MRTKFRAVRLAVAAMHLWIGLAQALPTKTFYVKPSGNNSSNGRSVQTAWQTMAKADAQATNFGGADSNITVIFRPPGTITPPDPEGGTATYTFPNPTTATTGGAVRTYMVSGDVSKNTRVTLGSAGADYSLSGATDSALTLKGFNIPGSVSILARSVGLDTCIVTKGFSIGNGSFDGSRALIRGCLFNATKFGAHWDEEDSVGVDNVGVKISGCSFPNLTNEGCGSAAIKIMFANDWKISQSMFKISGLPGTTGTRGIYFAWGDRDSIYDCHFDFNNNVTGNCPGSEAWCTWMIRDYWTNFVMVRDTIIVRGSFEQNLAWPTDGHSGNGGSCTGFRLDSLFIKSDFPNAIKVHSGWRDVSLTNSVVISKTGAAIGGTESGFRNVDIIHNTLGGFPDPELNTEESGVLRINKLYGDTTHVTDNIIFSFAPDRRNVDGPDTDHGWVYWADPDINPGLLVSDRNLIYNKVYRSVVDSAGQKDIGYSDGALKNTRPGTGPGSGFCAFSGDDCNSLHGSPRFHDAFGDSSFDTFTPRLDKDSSWANGRGLNGTNIGARAAITYPKVSLGRSIVNFVGDAGGTYYDTVSVYNFGTATLNLSNLRSSHIRVTPSLSATSVAAGAFARLALTVVGAPVSTTLATEHTVSFDTNDLGWKTPYVVVRWNNSSLSPIVPIKKSTPGRILFD